MSAHESKLFNSIFDIVIIWTHHWLDQSFYAPYHPKQLLKLLGVQLQRQTKLTPRVLLNSVIFLHHGDWLFFHHPQQTDHFRKVPQLKLNVIPLQSVSQAIHSHISVRVANLLKYTFDSGLIHQNIALILLFIVLPLLQRHWLRLTVTFTQSLTPPSSNWLSIFFLYWFKDVIGVGLSRLYFVIAVWFIVHLIDLHHWMFGMSFESFWFLGLGLLVVGMAVVRFHVIEITWMMFVILLIKWSHHLCLNLWAVLGRSVCLPSIHPLPRTYIPSARINASKRQTSSTHYSMQLWQHLQHSFYFQAVGDWNRLRQKKWFYQGSHFLPRLFQILPQNYLRQQQNHQKRLQHVRKQRSISSFI